MNRITRVLLSSALALGITTAALATPAGASTPTSPVVTLSSTGTPTNVVIITYQVWDNRFVLLCKEEGNPTSNIGTALTCNRYDMRVAGEAQRFGSDLRAWVVPQPTATR